MEIPQDVAEALWARRIEISFVPFHERNGTATSRFARALLRALERPPIKVTDQEKATLECLEAFQRAPYLLIGGRKFAVLEIRYRR